MHYFEMKSLVFSSEFITQKVKYTFRKIGVWGQPAITKNTNGLGGLNNNN